MTVARASAEKWNAAMAWRAQHRVAASSSWRKLIARPFSTVLIWLVVAISLSLPSSLLLTLDNLSRIVPDLAQGGHMSVMLMSEVDWETAQHVEQHVKAWPEVAGVDLISRDRALTEFGEQTGLSDVLRSLKKNPLPHTVQVVPAPDLSEVSVTALAERLSQLPEVEQVIRDTRWLARLQEALLAGWRWVTALGVAMVLGAVLALVNTLYLAIDARREEIEVASLIGGSAAFIRRPFLYTGLYFGAGGGVLAALCLWLFSIWLSQPLEALFGLYDMASPLRGPGLLYPAGLVAAGASVGWLAAIVALRRYFQGLETL